MKTIYLHIGMQKTGSTHLQAFLKNNKSYILERFNLNYLDSPKVIGNSQAHHNLAYYYLNQTRRISSSFPKKEVGKRFYSAIADSVSDVIISSEEFSYFDEEDISKFVKDFSDFNIKPIMFCREQTKLLESLYKQYIKVGWIYSIEDFIEKEKQRFKYDEVANKWSNITNNKMTVLKYEDSKNDNTVEKMLLIDGCNVSDDVFDFSEFSKVNQKKNISLSPELTLFQAEVFKHIEYDKKIRRKLESINHNFDVSSGYFFINQKNYNYLKSYYEESNLALSNNSISIEDYNIKNYKEHPQTSKYKEGLSNSAIAAVLTLLMTS